MAALETELFEAINQTGIGPQGLGGNTTALAVHIESAWTHITCNPVAVNMQCWRAERRRAKCGPMAKWNWDFKTCLNSISKPRSRKPTCGSFASAIQ